MPDVLGFLIHGFEKEDAEIILEFMKTFAGQEVYPMSATGLERKKVSAILNTASYENFASAEPRVFMFLGFNDDQISGAMKYFPIKERPIFCSLTEQNQHWTFDYLVEHLLEERAAFGNR